MGVAAILLTRAESDANVISFVKESKENQKQSHRFINLLSPSANQQYKLHYENLWNCFTRNFGKGFMLGAAVRVAAKALWLIFSMARGRKALFQKSTIIELLSNSRDLGLFSGALLSLFNSAAYITKKVDTKSTAGQYRGAIAGAVAGVSLLFAPKSTRWNIMLFTLVRGIEILLKIVASNGSLLWWLHPNAYGDLIIMTGSSSILLHLLVAGRQYLNPTYRKFLVKFSRLAPAQLTALNLMTNGYAVDIPGTWYIQSGDKLTFCNMCIRTSPVCLNLTYHRIHHQS